MTLQETIDELRTLIEGNEHCINDEIIDGIASFQKNVDIEGLIKFSPLFFAAHDRCISRGSSVEYYAVVDKDGKDTSLALSRRPLIENWIITYDKRVLVAQWLSHLLGFRHQSVHLFLDHPRYADYTFIQLRSFDVIGAPGKFDLAVGGQVSRSDDILFTLAKELREELGLNVEHHLRSDSTVYIGRYESISRSSRVNAVNVELRHVYRAQLEDRALIDMSFPDGEVAAVMMISKKELVRLIEKRSELIASGLMGSISFYLNQEMPFGKTITQNG